MQVSELVDALERATEADESVMHDEVVIETEGKLYLVTGAEKYGGSNNLNVKVRDITP